MSALRSGFNTPPGCFHVPGDEGGLCDICGKSVYNCVCPECPTCESQGDAACYKNHGLKLSKEQLVARAERAVALAREAVTDAGAYLDYVRDVATAPDLQDELKSLLASEQKDLTK